MKNSEFITGKVPITKEEVRAVILDKLALKEKIHLIDVGAGTGSISIQAAYEYPSLMVTAIEHKREAADLIKQNSKKFGLKNVEIVEKSAPCTVAKKADAIFVGGTGGKLEEIIRWSKDQLKERGIIVLSFILLENFTKAYELVKENGFDKVEVQMVSISNLEALGAGSYFKPANPIYIITAKKEN